VETVAYPAAERRSEHETDRTARERADCGTAADTDRFLFWRTVFRRREARRREQGADQRNNNFLGHEFRLHGSLLKRKGFDTALSQRTELTGR
jgi:hypothetical protein